MDFLLECIGFPPTYDLAQLEAMILADGEPIAWRGAPEDHRRLDLGNGLELRMEREGIGKPWSILPHFRASSRLRVAVESIRRLPDSPFDALLNGWAAPEVPSPEIDWTLGGRTPAGAYQLACFLTDARRLPNRLRRGQVLAVSVAGFALDVSYIGPNSGMSTPELLEAPRGALIAPLGGEQDPGGCAEVSLRIKELKHLSNPITEKPVDLLEADAPGRPLQLLISPWQLEQDGHAIPRPGWRIEGTFLFIGRIAGGLGGPSRKTGRAFG